jgi:outer membrane protein OmpA-like peptidoglycan-associated protein
MIKSYSLLVVSTLCFASPRLLHATESGEAPSKTPAAASDDAKAAEQSQEARRATLRRGSSFDGATGLLRVRSADGGAVGTFRLSVAASFYSGSNFLCPPCESPQGARSTAADSASLFGTRAQFAFTPLSFLEAHAAVRYQTTSNDQPSSRVIPIAGDSVLGLKAFLPTKPGRIYAFGGGAVLGFLGPADGLGVAAANVDLHADATLDFTELASPLPLRASLNLGYTFDNSGAIADAIEARRAGVLGGAQTISRVERFGYGINRTDFFKWGVGVEGAFDLVRPFVEWTMDVPVNRQGYVCSLAARTAGDSCLSQSANFASVPSRLSLGARAFPWLTSWTQGLALLLAADIGTGATSTFIEEVAPQAPYTLHFGLAYAFDTQPRVERVVVTKAAPAAAPVPAPAPRQYFVAGTVVDAQSGQPLREAAVFFEGSDKGAVLTAADGTFRTAPLAPGEYRFLVKKPEYLDGHCQAMLTEAAPPKAAAGVVAPPDPAVVETRCELSALPQVASVSGTVRSAASTEFVPNATVSARDARGREVAVQTDSEGSFRFENVPAGKLQLQVTRDGYLPTVIELELKVRTPASAQLFLNKRPAQASVVVTKTELKLKRQVHFLFDSAEIQPDSSAILEEIAEALKQHSEVSRVEIQGHTDDFGTAEHNLRLSEERAIAVKDALIVLGVDSSRLSARGYGKDKPLVPNSSPANRARNRRVQLMIIQ